MRGKSETNRHYHRRFPTVPSDNHVIAEMDFSRSDNAVLTAILCATLYHMPKGIIYPRSFYYDHYRLMVLLEFKEFDLKKMVLSIKSSTNWKVCETNPQKAVVRPDKISGATQQH